MQYSCLDSVWERYEPQDIPFLLALRHKMQEMRPYQGLRVLHNIPLTFEAAIKMHTLLLGGADVTASCVEVVQPVPDAIAALAQAGVPVLLDKTRITESFDVYLDCCGELVDFPATKIGAVELTQTGTKVYQNAQLQHPVISVDDCSLKHLETIGTGFSGIKALCELTQTDINGKKFVVFGYGKVGRGLVKALQQYTQDIVVIEADPELVHRLTQAGVYALVATDQAGMQKAIQGAFCLVTATGMEGCVSTYFDPEELTGIYLANMGAVDEFGETFKETDVLNAKMPINFAVQEPTLLRYLDPVLYAHNIALDLLLSGEFLPGYHSFPEDLSQRIVAEWADMHHIDLHDIFAL